jgi:hypothetical protein
MFWRAGDEAGLAQFIAAHDIRHRTYRLAASRLGRSLQPKILTGKMDHDWFARNLFDHMAHAAIFPGQASELTVALEAPREDDEGALYSWMRRHALIHARLDIAYGVT